MKLNPEYIVKPEEPNRDDYPRYNRDLKTYQQEVEPTKLIVWRTKGVKPEIGSIIKILYDDGSFGDGDTFRFSFSDFNSIKKRVRKWCYPKEWKKAKAIEDSWEPIGSGWKRQHKTEWIKGSLVLNCDNCWSLGDYNNKKEILWLQKDHPKSVEIINLAIKGI